MSSQSCVEVVCSPLRRLAHRFEIQEEDARRDVWLESTRKKPILPHCLSENTRLLDREEIPLKTALRKKGLAFLTCIACVHSLSFAFFL